jgi:Secretion system C-terminal sorting domain
MNKCIYFIFGIFLLASMVSAQIPNAGFENWTGDEPDEWLTNNSLVAGLITKTTDAHSGNAAVQGTVQHFMTIPFTPMLTSATLGFPVSSKPGALHGFYKLNSVGGDSLFVGILMSSGHVAIGAGIFVSGTTTGTYQEFVANINYTPSTTPDTGWITILLTNTDSVHTGSSFIVDDLSLTSANGVGNDGSPDHYIYALSQNYPNPFNPQTKIAYQLEEPSHVTIVLFDVLGKQVATVVDQNQTIGDHEVFFDGSNLPSGMYFYRMTAVPSSGSVITKIRKLIIMK